MRALLVLLLLTSSAFADSVSTRARSTSEIAPGVHIIRHPDAPDTFPQGNTTVIVGAREVLVIDSCYLPSSAREDVEQIRKWTPRPVRWLVNTHWHYDHTMGNGVYRDAFPGIAVVAQLETAKQIAGYNPQWFAKFHERGKQFQQRIDSRTDTDGRPLSPDEVKEYQDALAGLVPVGKEFAPLGARADLAPSVAFGDELDVDLGGREVRLLHLGRGNTAGDAIAYLPKEKIVVAGDLVDHPVPYLGGGYPVEEIATLEALARLDFDLLVPGHGDVLHGKAYVGQIIDLLRAVVDGMEAQLRRSGSGGGKKLDEVKKDFLAGFDVRGWGKRFAGDDKEAEEFFETFSLAGAIEAAYAELWVR